MSNTAPNISHNHQKLRKPNEAIKAEKSAADAIHKENESTTSSEKNMSSSTINDRLLRNQQRIPFSEDLKASTKKLQLRPPTSNEFTQNESKSQKKLNSNAEEFKPSQPQPSPLYPQPKSVSDRLKLHQGLLIDQPGPEQQHHYCEPINQSQDEQYYPSEEELTAVDLIDNIANLLAEDPGNFDDFSEQIRNIFKEFYSSEYVMTISMETIFKRSVDNSNFRYMGAKLYDLLDKLQDREKSLFRNLLDCKLCYQETEFQEQIESHEFDKVCGTLLFLSELYMQLKLEAIGYSILFGIDALLSITPKSQISKNTIKSVCFTLKLSGYDLEKRFPEKMTLIIERLKSFSEENDDIKLLVENISVLHEKSWGRKDSITSNTSNGFGDNSTAVGKDEPTFYGPDGKALTEEESNFLNSQHDNDSDYEFDGMDHEEGIDFRKFLYSSKRTI